MPLKTQSLELKPADGGAMRAYVSRNAELSPRFGLLVFPEVFGVNPHMRSVTDRFAEHGFLALCPEIFHRSAPAGWEGDYADWAAAAPHYQALTEEGFVADAKAGFDWLQSQGVDKVAAVGFCLGGRIAFVANSALPLSAAVSYYGGNIAPASLPRAKDQRGPVLFHWGGQDKHLTPEVVARVEKAMRDAGKEYVSTVYSKADHAFNCDARPNYHAESAELAWVATQTFLKLHLSKP
ncbi:MAG TPA: dienelactone hydrolase family protein [bacterium]|nr:dienelactone hydrolase family protein [bacterium]